MTFKFIVKGIPDEFEMCSCVLVEFQYFVGLGVFIKVFIVHLHFREKIMNGK